MINGISLEDAIAHIRSAVEPLGEETLPLHQAVGRVLARPVTAGMDQPPFDRSPLDGYAVIASDTKGADKQSPVTLRVTEKIYAGGESHVALVPGTCARIFTGAMLPQGADCIVMQERTDCGEDTVQIFQELSHNDNVVFRGEDFRAGSVLLHAGTRLDAAACAVLSSCGCSDRAELTVTRAARVCVICTGDELVYPYVTPLPAGKIYDSNLTYLLRRLEDMNIRGETGGQHFGDDPELLTGVIDDALNWADAVITTGGVSVGQKDYLPKVLDTLGADKRFTGLKMKPGSPLLFALCRGKPVLCLSGNPFAAAATFELVGRPMLSALSGDPGMLPRRRSAVLRTPFGKKSKGRRLIRARYDAETDAVTLPDGHSSGQLLSMVGCNCLVDIPAGTDALAAGTAVSIVLF